MYKTADQLNITKGERKWLIKTAKMLATMSPNDARKIDGVNMGFNLAQWFTREEDNNTRKAGKPLCGTIGCIKGWMGTLAFASDNAIDLGFMIKGTKALPSMFVDKPHPPMVGWEHSLVLYSLFTPDWVNDYENVTPKDASKTIIRFLKTGRIKYPLKYFIGYNKTREITRREELYG